MTVIALSFFALLLLGIPIAYVLGATSIIYMLFTDNSSLFTSSPIRMFSSLLNYSLLAIPLFVFVGELMNSGGITQRLINFSKVLLGHFRGGLAYVNLLANMFLASILGSANAQTAMMSRIMIPAMEKEGYPKEISAAVTVSSALLGPIIPPSLVFILYSVVAEVSVAQMFLGGIIPGLLLFLGIGIVIYILSIRKSLPKSERSSLEEIIKSLYAVIPALSIPTIIMAGILSGAFTATESAGIAALVAFVVGSFIYRELKWSDIPQMLERTAINSSIITIMVAMANLFGWVLVFESIPQTIGNLLISISDNPLVFLFFLNVFFIIVGMFIEGTAAIIILVPILLPTAIKFGLDPIHFGIIISINLIIGLITPPVGTALFITSAIGRVKIEAVARALIPFIAVSIVVLIIITYVPSTVLWTVNVFNSLN